MYEIDDREITNGAWRAVDGRFWELPERRPGTRMLLRQAENVSPTIALQAVATLRNRVDQLERNAVALAKAHGWSWRDIGDMLGISRSAAHRRHRDNLTP